MDVEKLIEEYGEDAVQEELHILSGIDWNQNEISLPEEYGNNVVWGDVALFRVIDTKEVSIHRWTRTNQTILQFIPLGIYFSTEWEQGLTENQHRRPYEYTECVLRRVYPVEKTVTVTEWVPHDMHN